MIFATVDMIVRRSLLERGLPIHYYAELLFHTTACIRDLTKDSLQIINTVRLPIGENGEIDLPDDFSDDLGLYIPSNNMLLPIPKNNSINPLRLIDSESGQFTQYPSNTTTASNGVVTFGFLPTLAWLWNINAYGEPTGRYFGVEGGDRKGYKVVRERRQIQLSSSFGESAILMYVSSGQSIDNASQVDWMAFRCIQTYADWQKSPNATNIYSPEAKTFYNEKRLFRANKDDLTVTDLRQIIHKTYMAAYKT